MMITHESVANVLAKLEEIVNDEPLPHEEEDFVPYEMYGGNMDDAYWAGCDSGEQELARELMNLLLGL